MIQIVRAERRPEQALEQVQVFVRRPRGADARHRVRVRRRRIFERLCRRAERVIPCHFAKLGRIPLLRLFDPVAGIDPILFELALVAGPFFVHVLVQPGVYPHQLAVAGLNRDVAADAAHRADRVCRLELPRTRREPICAGSQRPDRTQLNRVAAEFRLKAFHGER